MPFFNAHASAASSTTGPRDVLIRYAERFMRASAAWLIRCRVSGVSGQWMLTMSDVASSRSTRNGAAARNSLHVRVDDPHVRTPTARRATRLPDPAESDDAERLAAQLVAEHEVERPPLPGAASNQAIALADAARDVHDERPREIGGRLGQHIGCVGHDDAALRCAACTSTLL